MASFLLGPMLRVMRCHARMCRVCPAPQPFSCESIRFIRLASPPHRSAMDDRHQHQSSTRRIVRLRRQPKALSILAVMIVCLTVGGAIACQFHPASSEHGHENELPVGHHQGGHADGVSCLNATLPDDLVLVEFAFVSWAAMPIRLHATLFVSPLFIPPRYPA